MQQLFSPSTLSLITTFRCTAACPSCCFGCSPKASSVTMSLRSMRCYIDAAVEAFGETLKVVVFTGGECFLLGLRLRLAIAYASHRGLSTRVVTNGYWATSVERAVRTLRVLQRCGLNEINFSTGAGHQRWVPQNRVVNGCVAAARLAMPCVVNVEQHGPEDEGYRLFVEDARIAELLAQRDKGELPSLFAVMAGVWMEQGAGVARKGTKRPVVPSTMRGCDALFDAVSFSPMGELYACCGLTAKRNRHLSLALPRYPNGEDLREAWDRFAEDFLLLWIYAEGAASIYSRCLQRSGETAAVNGMHSCAVCQMLFHEESMARLRSVYADHRARVFQLCRLRHRLAESECKEMGVKS